MKTKRDKHDSQHTTDRNRCFIRPDNPFNSFGIIYSNQLRKAMIQQFRKKPVVIDAIQFTYANANECVVFIGSSVATRTVQGQPLLVIQTLEGEMLARVGDWIIKGVNGEFYPCKPDIFEKTYGPVDSPYVVKTDWTCDDEGENKIQHWIVEDGQGHEMALCRIKEHAEHFANCPELTN